MIRELSDAVRAGGRVVVLTDAGVAGRQLRSRIVQQVPGAWHAFLGAHETTAERDTKHHKAGNVGVEHAAPEAIRKALNLARPAASEGFLGDVAKRVRQGEIGRVGLVRGAGRSRAG